MLRLNSVLFHYLGLDRHLEVRVIVENIYVEKQMLHLLLDPEVTTRITELIGGYKEGDIVSGEVLGRIRKGVLLDISVPAVLSLPSASLSASIDSGHFHGQRVEAQVIGVDPRNKYVEVSQKHLIIERLKVGDLCKGRVKTISDYGAFIDIGGCDGLLHKSEMDWVGTNHPRERVSVGEELEVMIIEIDLKNDHVSLSLKQTLPDPWAGNDIKYSTGARVRGKVTRFLKHRASVQLEAGVEGFIHMSEVSWNTHINRISDILTIGDEVEAVILSVNAQHRQILLSMRQLKENPWKDIARRYPIGSIVLGKVITLTSFGAFVEIEDGIEGMIHVSEMSRAPIPDHSSEVLKEGEEIETVVLETDPTNQRISLRLKGAHRDS